MTNFKEQKEIRSQFFEADKLIRELFKDKVDKGGHEYIGHMYRIVDAIDNEKQLEVVDPRSTLALFYDKAVVVAMLHDILEDTEYTELQLREIFDDEIVDAVIAITRQKSEQYYFNYIERVAKNDLARFVKIYDLEDNMNIRRLSKFEEYEQKRLKKYWYCWKYLKREITAIQCNNAIHPDRKMR